MSPESLLSELRPYVLLTSRNRAFLDLDIDLGYPVQLRELENRRDAAFGHVLNQGNQLAFGGPNDMGMPLWVLLDCAILPSAVVGFTLPRQAVPAQVLDQLHLPDGYSDPVAVTEYCACPTVEPGCWSGFSLHSHLTGYGLATRTKAFALAVYGARAQVGVTQFHNAAIRTHVRFGHLEILLTKPNVHTHPQKSFVYRVDVPPKSELVAMARGQLDAASRRELNGEPFRFEPDHAEHHALLEDWLRSGRRVWVVSPGWERVEGGRCAISLVVEHQSRAK